jgi:uncharacterized membrane protein
MAFVDKTLEVAADVRRVYELWTAFEDYPKFMETIETVTHRPSTVARPARSASRSSPPPGRR